MSDTTVETPSTTEAAETEASGTSRPSSRRSMMIASAGAAAAGWAGGRRGLRWRSGVCVCYFYRRWTLGVRGG